MDEGDCGGCGWGMGGGIIILGCEFMNVLFFVRYGDVFVDLELIYLKH